MSFGHLLVTSSQYLALLHPVPWRSPRRGRCQKWDGPDFSTCTVYICNWTPWSPEDRGRWRWRWKVLRDLEGPSISRQGSTTPKVKRLGWKPNNSRIWSQTSKWRSTSRLGWRLSSERFSCILSDKRLRRIDQELCKRGSSRTRSEGPIEYTLTATPRRRYDARGRSDPDGW